MPEAKLPQKLLESVLLKIKPSKGEIEKEKRLAEEIVSKIKKTEGEHTEVVLAGSIARNTHLKNDRDIDVFVLFPPKTPKNSLEKEITKIAGKVFPKTRFEKAFSEHPYLRANVQGTIVEIVPSYSVEKAEMLQSAVDRSPFHAKYVQKKLSEKQKDEVRLLKQFLKGINAYGAEIKTESMPGYLTELLIINYGTFFETIMSAGKWKKSETIDIEKHLQEKQLHGFASPLIVIDPVDPNRNVAAALSLNQMARFVAAAREFTKKPLEKFFFGKKEKPLGLKQVKKFLEKENQLIIETAYPKVVSDISWGQLKRLAKKTAAELSQKEFRVLRKDVFTDEKNYMAIVLDLEANVLEKAMKRVGPEVFDGENSKKFLQSHKKPLSGPRIEEGRWVIETDRPEPDAGKLIEKFLQKEKKTQKWPLKKALRKKAKVLSKKEVLEKYAKDSEFREFFSHYLKGKESFL